MTTRILWLTGLLACTGACGDSDAGNQPADLGDQSEPTRSGNQSALPRTTFEDITPPRGPGALIPPSAVIAPSSLENPGAEIAFNSGDRPEHVLAWYRSPERRSDFRLISELREGAELVLSGSAIRPPLHFTVRISPAAGDGTTGILLFEGR